MKVQKKVLQLQTKQKKVRYTNIIIIWLNLIDLSVSFCLKVFNVHLYIRWKLRSNCGEIR